MTLKLTPWNIGSDFALFVPFHFAASNTTGHTAEPLQHDTQPWNVGSDLCCLLPSISQAQTVLVVQQNLYNMTLQLTPWNTGSDFALCVPFHSAGSNSTGHTVEPLPYDKLMPLKIGSDLRFLFPSISSAQIVLAIQKNLYKMTLKLMPWKKWDHTSAVSFPSVLQTQIVLVRQWNLSNKTLKLMHWKMGPNMYCILWSCLQRQALHRV